MPYGILRTVDVQLLESALNALIGRFRQEQLQVLEIGVREGRTARGIKEYLDARAVAFRYFGVDSGRDLPVEPPLVLGDSAEVYGEIPDDLHLVFIDWCHCINHVMLDFLHYASKVVADGLVVFHDVKPKAQRKGDYQSHGPRENPDFGTAVRPALEKLGLLGGRRMDWELVWADWDDQDWGGIALCRRLADPGETREPCTAPQNETTS